MTKIDLSLDITSSSTQDAVEWIQKSRRRQEEEEKKKKLRQSIIKYDEDEEDGEEQEEEEEANQLKRKTITGVSDLRPSKRQKSSNDVYTSQQLKGLQIMHGVKDFEVGHELILTLADTSVLATDEDGRILGMNEEADVLENVNFSERERLQDAEKRRKKLKQPHYTGYDDAEFDENLPLGSKPAILSQYDKEKKKAPKLMIVGNNQHTENGTTETKEEKNKEYLKRKYETLQMELKPASSYLAADEIKFRKSLKARKKPNVRKSTNDEDGGDSANGGGESSSAMEIEEKKVKFDSFVYDDEDPELSRALSRARQLALQKREQASIPDVKVKSIDAAMIESKVSDLDDDEEDIDRGAKIARELTLKSTAVKTSTEKAVTADSTSNSLEDIDLEGRRSDGKLIFNSTTEFTTRLQARLNEHARSKAEAALRDIERQTPTTHHNNNSVDVSVTKNGLLSNQKKVVHGSSSVAEEEMSVEHRSSVAKSVGSHSKGSEEESENEEDEDHYDWEGLNDEELTMGTASVSHGEEATDEQLAFLHQQPTLNKGMAGALELLRSSGELKKQNQLAGRAKDDRSSDPSKDDKGIKLEYRDEFGRKLTRKEAFRQLSYKFHGYGPGKKKLEKRLKQIEEERKMTKARSKVLDGSAGTMKSFAKAQEATGKAHIVVQGGAAPSGLISRMAANMAKKHQNSSSKDA